MQKEQRTTTPLNLQESGALLTDFRERVHSNFSREGQLQALRARIYQEMYKRLPYQLYDESNRVPVTSEFIVDIFIDIIANQNHPLNDELRSAFEEACLDFTYVQSLTKMRTEPEIIAFNMARNAVLRSLSECIESSE